MAAQLSAEASRKRKTTTTEAECDARKDRKLATGFGQLGTATTMLIYGFLRGRLDLATVNKVSAGCFRLNDIWRYWYTKLIVKSTIWKPGYALASRHAWRAMSRQYIRQKEFEKTYQADLEKEDYDGDVYAWGYHDEDIVNELAFLDTPEERDEVRVRAYDKGVWVQDEFDRRQAKWDQPEFHSGAVRSTLNNSIIRMQTAANLKLGENPLGVAPLQPIRAHMRVAIDPLVEAILNGQQRLTFVPVTH